MFLSDTEQLVQEKVSWSFWGFAIIVHSSVSDELFLSGHSLSHHTMPAMCQCRRLSQELLWEPEKRILPYTLKVLPVRALHTGWLCGACLHLNIHLDTFLLGLSWAKHHRINQHQTCIQSCTAVLSLQEHRENARDILQLTGMHRVIKNYLWDPICTKYKAELVGMMLQEWPTEVCRPPGRLLWK